MRAREKNVLLYINRVSCGSGGDDNGKNNSKRSHPDVESAYYSEIPHNIICIVCV